MEMNDKEIRLAEVAKALGHPTRIWLMEFLMKQSCCFSGDISDMLGIAKSTLSKHLSILKNAGLVKGEFEPPKVKYCLNLKVWVEARELLEEFMNMNVIEKSFLTILDEEIMKIQVLGPGCKKCVKTYDMFAKEIKELGIDVELEKIEDINEIMKFNVMTTPAIAINGKIAMAGRTPKVKEVREILQSSSQSCGCCCS